MALPTNVEYSRSDGEDIFYVGHPDVPAWRAAMTTKTWAEIPSTDLRQIDPENDVAINPNYPAAAPWRGTNGLDALMQSWGGAVSIGNVWHFNGGGHGNSADNAWYKINLFENSPTWNMPQNPSGALPGAITLDDGLESTGVYSDGRFRSTHTYNALQYRPASNEIIMGIIGGVYKTGARYPTTQLMLRFNGSTNVETVKSSTNSFAGSGSSAGAGCYDSSRDKYWWRDRANAGKFSSYVFDGSDTWVEETNTGLPPNSSPNFQGIAMTYLPSHDLILMTVGNNVDTTTMVNQGYLYDPVADTWTAISFTGTPTGTYVSGDMQPRLVGDRLYFWNNHSDAEIINYMTIPANPKVDSWVISQVTNDVSNSVIPSTKQGNGTFGRFEYFEDLHGFALVNDVDENIYFYALEDV